MALTIKKCIKISLESTQKAHRMCFVQFMEIRGIYKLDFPEFPKGTILDIQNGAFCVVDNNRNNGYSKEQLKQLFLFYNATKNFFNYKDIRTIWESNKSACHVLYEANPYFVLDDRFISKEKQENFSFTYKELLTYITPTTFAIRREEICFCIIEELKKEEAQGHSYCEFEILERRVRETLSIAKHPLTQAERNIAPFINYKVKENVLYCDIENFTKKSPVFRRETYDTEDRIYNGVKLLMNARNRFYGINRDNNPCLSDEQNNAVNAVFIADGNINIITGGPGTGKTTIINDIIRSACEFDSLVNIKVIAPTGRAAKRAEETIEYRGANITISTAHKFVGYGSTFAISDVEKYDLIIFDEASMASPNIFQKLLSMMDKNTTKLVLVGDIDQLPSIEPGDILNDLIYLGVPTSYLTVNYRSDGIIVSNAHKINDGICDLEYDSSFELIDTTRKDIKEIRSGIVQAFSENTEGRNYDSDIVISPYVTELIEYSSSIINKEMHNGYINQNLHARKMCQYYYNEPVILIKTNYRAGTPYFNGEMGRVTDYHTTGDYIEYEIMINEDRTIIAPAEHVDFAYAITVHKSQGSEYPEVLFVAPEFSPFVTRKIFYTAITRAKQKVKIWSTPKIIKQIINNIADQKRKTLLKLKKKFK